MKSPYVYFFPAALGAAGMCWLLHPSPQRNGQDRPADATRGARSRVADFDGNRGISSDAMRPRREWTIPERDARARPGTPPIMPVTYVAQAVGGAGDNAGVARPRLSRRELERRAAQVEIEANRALERLIPALGLSEAQQPRVFGILGRHSPAFDPIMRIDPGDGTEPRLDGTADAESAGEAEELYAALEPLQQVALEELYEDQNAWWQDIVDQLVPESAVPALGGEAPPMMADDKPSPPAANDVTGAPRRPSS